MTKYKCGHESNVIILDENLLSMASYIEWSETVGLHGSKSKCWECFCKETSNIISNKKENK